MKRTLLHCLPALLAAVLCAGFASCGDDDKELTPSYETPDTSSGSATPTPEQMLPGRWEGTGTNDDGNTCTLKLTLNPDGTGTVFASCRTRLIVKKIIRYSYESNTALQMDLGNGESQRPYINSRTATSMERSLYDGPDDLQTTYYLTKTEDYSGGGDDGSSSEADIEEAPTLVIRHSDATGRYTSSSETYYKKMSSTGKYTLYRNSNGTGEIGIASSNSLSTWGGYRVSSYDYVYRDVSITSSTYYFFN